MKFPLFLINLALAKANLTQKNIISVILPEGKLNIYVVPNQETFIKNYCDDAIQLLNNKFCELSPSGGSASLSFDQGVRKKLPTTTSSSRSERHLSSNNILHLSDCVWLCCLLSQYEIGGPPRLR